MSFYVFILYAFTFYFSDGLMIYVGLLLLTPKVLNLPFTLKTTPSCLGLILMLHSTIGLIVGSVEHSPLHQLKAFHGGFLHFKENTLFNSVNIFANNNHV